MKKRWLILLLALAPFLTGATFGPGDYPGVYNSGSSLVTSGVIWGGTNVSNFGACEFYTNAAATQYFMVYNSATVAGQTVANMLSFCAVSATAPEVCSVTAGGPTGPAINAAIVAGKGLSWSASSTFPSQTQPSANSFALCTFNVR